MYSVMLSAPGYQFSVLTSDTDFLLPTPKLVHGSFFTKAAWTARGISGALYGIASDASEVAFRVINVTNGSVIAHRQGVWQQWWEDGIRAYYKQSTVYVRANGFEVNATRKPIYHLVKGPSQWRFDIAMRKLDDTGKFEHLHGKSSSTCFPHGIIGQSWDGDNMKVNGAVDDYNNDTTSEMTTTAQAEGAIEGTFADYLTEQPHNTSFGPFARFHKSLDSVCAPRRVATLHGSKHTTDGSEMMSSTHSDLEDIVARRKAYRRQLTSS